MWPSSTGGVKVSYGHDGAGLYLPNMLPDQPWQFARTHGNGYHFYETGSTVLIPPIEGELQHNAFSNSKKSIMRGMKHMRDAYVPSDVIADFAAESNNLNSPLKYDPVKGKLMDLGVFMSRSKARNGIACVDGMSGGTAVRFSEYSVSSEDDGTTGSNNHECDLVNGGLVVDLKSKIMQVDLWQGNDGVCPYGLVRTTGGTSLLRIERDHKLEYDSAATFEFDLYTGIPGSHECQVHASFNPYNWRQVAIIDDVGSWTIHEFREKAQRTDSGVPHASKNQHASRWNRIIWGKNSDSLIIANRSHARYYDRRSRQSNDLLVCPYGISQICDIAASPLNEHENFVLTSDRLIWTDQRVPNKILLEWDHYMSSKDTSLQMALCKVDEVATIALHSQLMQANLVYQFTQTNGLPVSADDPYYYLGNPELVTQSLALKPVMTSEAGATATRSLCSFRFSNDYGLVAQMLSTNKSDSGELPEIKRVSLENEQQQQRPLPKKSNSSVNTYDFTDLYRELFPEVPPVKPAVAASSEEGEKELQSLAKTFGEQVKNLHTKSIHSIYSLHELAEPPVLFEDLQELSSMIDQLQQHFSSTSINVFPLTYDLKTLFHDKVKNIPDIYNHLMDLWVSPLNSNVADVVSYRRQKLAWHITARLAMSCMGVHSQKDIIDTQSKLGAYTDCKLKRTGLKPTTKLLLSEWEVGSSTNDYTWFKFGIDEEEKQSQIESSQAVPVSMPMSMSMPMSLNMSVPPTPIPSQPDFSQATSLASQRSRTPKPRKKKRREGFA